MKRSKQRTGDFLFSGFIALLLTLSSCQSNYQPESAIPLLLNDQINGQYKALDSVRIDQNFLLNCPTVFAALGDIVAQLPSSFDSADNLDLAQIISQAESRMWKLQQQGQISESEHLSHKLSKLADELALYNLSLYGLAGLEESLLFAHRCLLDNREAYFILELDPRSFELQFYRRVSKPCFIS